MASVYAPTPGITQNCSTDLQTTCFFTHTEVSELVIISTEEPVYYSEGKAGTQEAVWNCESKIIKLGCVNNGNCYRTEII